MAARRKGRRKPRRRNAGRTSGTAIPLIGVAGFALLLGLYARHDPLLPWLAAVYAGLSVFTLGLYAWDKRAAVHARSRVPEQSLHLLSLAGGWPGSMLARPLFRHKTRKQPFTGIFWCTVLLNMAMVAALLW